MNQRPRSSSVTTGDDAEEKERRIKKAKITAYVDLTDGNEQSQAKSTLCERCTEMEQNSLFAALEQTIGSKGPISLGTLDPVKTPSCQLCQLFSAITNSGEDDRGPKKEYLVAYRIAESNVWGMRGSFLTVASSLDDKDLDKAIYERGSICKATDHWSAGPGPLKSAIGLCIQPQNIDYKQIRHWIDSCAEFHTKCKRYADKTNKPIELKLIDCETRRITRTSSSAYVALSYVWGLPSLGPGYDDRPKDDRLPDNLLPTIEDALTVTRELGYRYLWIDRFCIDQANEYEKEVQIGQMNLIYRQAEVTIIAVAGGDPRFGLPGVGNRSRASQPRAYVGGAQYVSVMNPSETINKSIWNTRGWTYQEGYFSRRRLYFLEDQIFFSCYDGSALEMVCHMNQEGRPYASEAVDDGINPAFKMLSHLTSYSGRQLTHGSDAINAVAGVFNDYGFRDGPTPHHLGVPIVSLSLWNSKRVDAHLKERKRRVTDAFLNGLSWQNRRPGRRRNIWPSWTWAEWEVGFDYGFWSGEMMESFAATIKFQRPLPRVVIEKRSGTVLDLELPYALETIRRDKDSLSKFIRISSWTCELLVHVMEDKHEALFPGVQLPKKSDGTSSSRVERFYGTFKDSTVDIKMPLWPLHPSFSEDPLGDGSSPSFAPSIEMDAHERDRNVVGIVLSRVWLSHGHWLFNMMLLQDQGSHYEKVGHCCIHSNDVRALGMRRRLISNADWPDDNHHSTPTKYITNVMNSFMPWKELRIG